MAIHMKCGHCGHILNVPDEMEGKSIRCPNCEKKTVAIPEPEGQSEEASAGSLAQSDYGSLRVMGKVFVFVGYILAIVAVAYGLYIMVKLSDTGWTWVSLIAFLKYFIAALAIFVACKFAGELSRVLADIGENEASMVKLLRDLNNRLSQSAKR